MGVLIIRWVFVPAMLLSGGFLVASNLLLQTKAARGWFERQLERRSGLAFTIESISWTPWSGVQVGGVKAELPGKEVPGAEPLYAVGAIDMKIYWDLLLKGVLAPRDIHVRQVRGALPIELMGLLPEPQGPAAETGDEVLAAPPEVPPPPAPRAPDSVPKAGGPGEGTTSAPPTGAAGSGDARQPPEGAPRPARPPAGRPLTVRMEDCELKVYSVSGGGKGGLAFHGVEAEFSLGGEDADGWLAIGAATVGGEAVGGAFRTPLRWSRPFLVIPAASFEWSGITLHAAASLQTRGAPMCNAELRVLPGPVEATPLPIWPAVSVAATRAQFGAIFRGNLAKVRTWHGDSIAEVEGLEVRPEGDREMIPFDFGRVTAVMRGRAFQVVDARLLSERLSFLGNGVALPNGEVIGIGRIIVDHEYAESLTKVAVGSFLAGGWVESWFAPLVTPDRYFRDIHLRGAMRSATVDVGREGGAMPVAEAVERTAAFLKSEVAETERGVEPSLPRERIWLPQPQVQ